MIYFGNEDYILNEIKFNLLRGRYVKNSSILNEEKKLVKKP